MKDLNSFLSRSFRWLSFEALGYQSILLAHQLLLFRLSDYKTYGLIGAVFSLVYLVVAVSDLGLESSISPFFSFLIKGKSLFRRFIVLQLFPGILTVFGVFGVVFFAKSWIKLAVLSHISTVMLVSVGLLALSETVKKTVRTVMHLAFLNKEAAFIEVGTILGYVVLVWSFYFLGYPIGLPLIFVPMLVTSVVSTVVMIFLVWGFSVSLPMSTLPVISQKRVIVSRFFNYLSQLSHLIFSSNFLVPFFAFQFGLAHAGVFKLVSHIAYGVTSVLRKTFGLTSDAMLAKAKEMSLATKRAIFLRVTQKLHHALYGIIIFFAVNHAKILSSGSSSGGIDGSLVYLFLFICLSENFFIAYEKFYITQERAGSLLAFNVATMLLIYGVVRIGSHFSQLGVLVAIVAVRVCMFALLSMLSFYTWNIKPQWRMQPRYLVVAFSIALGFFVLF